MFLLTVYAKNQKANLTKAERNDLKNLVPLLVKTYAKGGRLMKKRIASKRTGGQQRVGQEIITSMKEAIAWAGGEDVPVRVTVVRAPTTDVRAVRRKLGLSQSEFAARFGFQPATLKNWEQGRTRPDGPARVLLAVIARHPEAVEDALRKGIR